jgi:Protein of unknown function (DUF1838)
MVNAQLSYPRVPDMSKTSTRRQYIFGMASAVPGLALADASIAAPHAATPVTFASSQDALEALVRVMGDTRDQQAPWWYTGTILGVRPGEPPTPLMRFEGAEINFFMRQTDDSFRQSGTTTTFFRDLRNGNVLNEFANPYTGQMNAVRPNKLGGSNSYMWWRTNSIQAFFAGFPPADEQPLIVHWTAHRDLVWMRHDRVFPPGMPQPIFEASTSIVRRKDLLNRRLGACPAQFSSTYIAPWPRWMEMGDAPGHVVWHADGLKLQNVAALPTDYLERMRQLYPEQLTVAPPPAS